MNKEEFKADHFKSMEELLDTIKVWLINEEDYGTLYDDFNRYFDTGAMEEMYYYIKSLQQENKQLKDNWNKLKELFDIKKESEEYDAFKWLEYQTTNYENDSIILHRYKILYNFILNSQQKNKELEQRIDKAIEYIEKSKLNQLDTYCKYLYIDFDTGKIENINELLKILKGEE